MLPDMESTAKAIYLNHALGQSVSFDGLISRFMAPDGDMMTDLGEQDLSLSANCNAMICILDSPDLQGHIEVVRKIASSLCDHWWDDKLSDKWYLSDTYAAMMLAQSLTKLLQRWDSGSLDKSLDSLVQDRITVVLYQLLNRMLFKSESLCSPSTQPYPESVAYEVLACNALRSLPVPKTLLAQLGLVIQRGQEYLTGSQSVWKSAESQALSEAYCLGALYARPEHPEWNKPTNKLFQPSSKMTSQLSRFFHAAQGQRDPLWKFEACILEGSAFTPQLRACRGEIFPLREGFKDEYLAYIPAAWTIINNMRGLRCPTTLLWEMMRISLTDFLVDEYMESSVAFLDAPERNEIRSWITTTLLPTMAPEANVSRKRPFTPDTDDDDIATFITDPKSSERVQTVKKILAGYIKDVLLHAKVRIASQYDRNHVRRELHDFLTAHMLQMDDNISLPPQDSSLAILSSPRSSFYVWARTTGSQHISCPLSFAFYSCLLATDRHDCFPTPEQKYKASSFCAHLAVMSRLFNDWASVARDRKEGNLNSLNFPEFQVQRAAGDAADGHDSAKVEEARKSLLRLSEYERQASRQAMADLLGEMQDGMKCRAIELFHYVTELFADMYVAKDLTNAAVRAS
ncbi:hypothetical protein BU26DRAFT_305847 [Trematosphaeria pertusa]|uniref:Ent-kaurene synthase n=1 Tax=Trematosphaeria pertusa TaxID=390896 RepID=A0A6A6IDY6_9PLEO|nr:uncharacterized protein BU26DRAFT_305847 [Trematosphaeria pertusa]KAF2248785.1 hypothetical protein BU26DRAFT_305847 [Trematosphaeria pertusa]